VSYKNGVLEGFGLDFKGPGLDFGGPEARFGRVRERFFREFGFLSKTNAGTDFELEGKAVQANSYFELRPRFSRREGGRRWSPPGGLSIRRPPKVVHGVLD